MLDEQPLPDQVQHFLPGETDLATAGEQHREWLERIENDIDLALVPAQRNGFGQRVGQNQKAIAREIDELHRLARRNGVVRRSELVHNGDFVVVFRAFAIDPLFEFLQEFFFERTQSGQHGDANL